VASAIKERGDSDHVWCFIGDGAEDNGHACESIRYGHAQNLPLTFIIEDNDRQVDTDYQSRWGSAERFAWPDNVIRYCYTPTFPHGGAGLPAGSVKFNADIVRQFAK
jgi:hypothetical protein